MTTLDKYNVHIRPGEFPTIIYSPAKTDAKVLAYPKHIRHFSVNSEGALRFTDGFKFYLAINNRQCVEIQPFCANLTDSFLYLENNTLIKEISILSKLDFYNLNIRHLSYSLDMCEKDIFIYLFTELYRTQTFGVHKVITKIADYKYTGAASRRQVWLDLTK